MKRTNYRTRTQRVMPAKFHSVNGSDRLLRKEGKQRLSRKNINERSKVSIKPSNFHEIFLCRPFSRRSPKTRRPTIS